MIVQSLEDDAALASHCVVQHGASLWAEGIGAISNFECRSCFRIVKKVRQIVCTAPEMLANVGTSFNTAAND
jgi:hypothetical protein